MNGPLNMGTSWENLPKYDSRRPIPFLVPQTPLIQVPRPRAKARGYPPLRPPVGAPLVSPGRISWTPECPVVCIISGGLHSLWILLVCMFPWVQTSAIVPFRHTSCFSFAKKPYPPPVPHSYGWNCLKRSWNGYFGQKPSFRSKSKGGTLWILPILKKCQGRI